MSSDKKRDVAKEFVDFLLAEDKDKRSDNTSATSRTKKTDEIHTAVVENTAPFDHHAAQTHSLSSDPVKSLVTPKTSIGPDRGKQIFNEVSKLAGGSEAIRVAQARIQELEKERDDLRSQIDGLLVDCESLQRQAAELRSQMDSYERKQKEKLEISEEEKLVMRERLKARDKEVAELKRQNEEMNSRFQNDLQRIRVREKEYENKNILLKAETNALTQVKDEMILDLKRKIDQFQFELDNFKTKFSHSESSMQEMRDRQVRTIKALRLALSILENNELEENTFVRASGDE